MGHDLDETTPLYVDFHVALECLHLTYRDYIRRTTPVERVANRLFVALKAAKEKHIMDHQDDERELEQMAQDAITPPHLRP